jgi:hypothetical protein
MHGNLNIRINGTEATKLMKTIAADVNYGIGVSHKREPGERY